MGKLEHNGKETTSLELLERVVGGFWLAEDGFIRRIGFRLGISGKIVLGSIQENYN